MKDKNKIIIIPRVKNPLQKRHISLKRKKFHINYFILVFFLFIGFLVLNAYLPNKLSLKVLNLLIGSFILEDILHSLKWVYSEENFKE